MALAGMRICLIPAYTPVIPGLVTRPVVDPDITRTINVATVVGRQSAGAAVIFIKAAEAYGDSISHGERQKGRENSSYRESRWSNGNGAQLV